MSFRPAGAEDSSDEDDFHFGDNTPNVTTAKTNSHPTSTPKPTHSIMPAGAESSDEDYDDFGSFSSRSTPQNKGTSNRATKQGQGRSGNPVAIVNEQPVGRGRGMLEKRGRGRGGFGSPSQSSQAGRDKKRSPYFSKNKAQSAAAQKPAGPSPVELEDFKVAVVKGNTESVEKCLANGISADAMLSSGWTALMHAANSGKADILEILIRKGANVNFQKDMYTVLMAACDAVKSADEEEVATCVDLLLENGARIGLYDRHRITPLMYAAREGRVSVCMKLIKNGAQVDKQDIRGWTALSWAASEGHGRLVRVLLDHKADPKMYTNDGQAPSDIAYTKGHDTIAGILEAAASGSLGVRMQVDAVSAFRGEEGGLSHSITSYDELDLFLSGLELGHLVPKFKEHKISFIDLLKMTEADLEQMGVSQLGVRKKLLDATRDVHTKEWNTTSLQQRNKKLISGPEVTNVLANISKHLAVVHSSVGYVQKHMQAVTDPAQFLQSVSEAEGLVLYAKEAANTSTTLQQDLASLQCKVNELSTQTALISADLITNPTAHQPTTVRTRSIGGPLLFLAIAGAALGVMYYKKYVT